MRNTTVQNGSGRARQTSLTSVQLKRKTQMQQHNIQRWELLESLRQSMVDDLQSILKMKADTSLPMLFLEIETLSRDDEEDGEILDRVKHLFIDFFYVFKEQHKFINCKFYYLETTIPHISFIGGQAFLTFMTSGILPQLYEQLSPDTTIIFNSLFTTYSKEDYEDLVMVGTILASLGNGVPNDTVWKNLSPFDYILSGIETQQMQHDRLQADKKIIVDNYQKFGKKYEQTMGTTGDTDIDATEKASILKQFKQFIQGYMVSETQEKQLLPPSFQLKYPNFMRQVKRRRQQQKSKPKIVVPYTLSLPRQRKTLIGLMAGQKSMLGEFISHGGTMQRSIKNDFMRFSEIITRNMLTAQRLHTLDFSFWEKEVSGKTMGYVGNITVFVVKETSESKDKYKYKLMSVTKNRDSKRYEKQATKPNLVWVVTSIVEGSNLGHMNALIYQKRIRQFYYIEPNGTETGSMLLPGEKFTPFWEDFAKSDTFPREADKSKLPNFVLGKDKGLQPKVQEKQIRPGEKVIRQGFCVTVSLFVVKLFELNHTRIETIDDFQKMMEIFMAISTLTGTLPGIVQAFNVRIMRTFLTLVRIGSMPVYSTKTIEWNEEEISKFLTYFLQIQPKEQSAIKPFIMTTDISTIIAGLNRCDFFKLIIHFQKWRQFFPSSLWASGKIMVSWTSSDDNYFFVNTDSIDRNILNSFVKMMVGMYKIAPDEKVKVPYEKFWEAIQPGIENIPNPKEPLPDIKRIETIGHFITKGSFSITKWYRLFPKYPDWCGGWTEDALLYFLFSVYDDMMKYPYFPQPLQAFLQIKADPNWIERVYSKIKEQKGHFQHNQFFNYTKNLLPTPVKNRISKEIQLSTRPRRLW